MTNYKKMYKIMFNAVTDAADKLEGAAIILRAAQQKCEDIYIEAGEGQAPLVTLIKAANTTDAAENPHTLILK